MVLVQHEFAHGILQKYGMSGQLDLGRLGLVYKQEGADEVDTAPLQEMLTHLQAQIESLKHKEAPGMITKRETLMQLQKVLERHVHHPAVTIGSSVPLQAQRARTRANASVGARELTINEVSLQQAIRLVQTAAPTVEAESVAKVLREALPRVVSTEQAGRVRAIEAVLQSVLPKSAPSASSVDVRTETLTDVLREEVASEVHVQQLATAIREVVTQQTMPSRGQVNQLVKVLREAAPERTQGERVVQEIGRTASIDERVKSLATVLRDVLPGSAPSERIEAAIQRLVTTQKLPHVIREVLPAVAEIERVERTIRTLVPNATVLRREHVESLVKELRHAGQGGVRTESLERVIRTVLPIREGAQEVQVQSLASVLREVAAGTSQDTDGLERVLREVLSPQAVQDRQQVRMLVNVLRETGSSSPATPGERLEQVVQTIVPQASTAKEFAYVLREVVIGNTYSTARFEQVLQKVLPGGMQPKQQQVKALMAVLREVVSGDVPIERLETGIRNALPLREGVGGESIKSLVNVLQEVVSNHTQSLRLERILRTVLSANTAPSQEQVRSLVTVLHETMIGTMQAERLESVLRDVFPAQATNTTFVTVVRNVLTGRAPLEQLKQVILRPAALQAESLAESLLQAMPGSGHAERLAQDIREVWSSETSETETQTELLANIIHTVLAADRVGTAQPVRPLTDGAGVSSSAVAAAKSPLFVSLMQGALSSFVSTSVMQNETFVNAVHQSLFLQQGTAEHASFLTQFVRHALPLGVESFTNLLSLSGASSSEVPDVRLIFAPARELVSEDEQVAEARTMRFERLLRSVLQRTSTRERATVETNTNTLRERDEHLTFTPSASQAESTGAIRYVYAANPSSEGNSSNNEIVQTVVSSNTIRNERMVDVLRSIFMSQSVSSQERLVTILQASLDSGSATQTEALSHLVRAMRLPSSGLISQAGALVPFGTNLQSVIQSNLGLAPQMGALLPLNNMMQSVLQSSLGTASQAGTLTSFHSVMQNVLQSSLGNASQAGTLTPFNSMMQSVLQSNLGIASHEGTLTLLNNMMQSGLQSSLGIAQQAETLTPLTLIMRNLYQSISNLSPQAGALATLPPTMQSIYQSSSGLASHASLPLIMQSLYDSNSGLAPQRGALAPLSLIMQSLYQPNSGSAPQRGALAPLSLIMQSLYQPNSGSAPQMGALAPLSLYMQSLYQPNSGSAPQRGALAPLSLIMQSMYQPNSGSAPQSGALTPLSPIMQSMYQPNSGSAPQMGALAPLSLIMQSLYQPNSGSAPQRGALAPLSLVMQSLYQSNSGQTPQSGSLAPLPLIVQSLYQTNSGSSLQLGTLTPLNLSQAISGLGTLTPLPLIMQSLYQSNSGSAPQRGALASFAHYIQSLYQSNFGLSTQVGALAPLTPIMQSLYQSSSGFAPQSGAFMPLPLMMQSLYQSNSGLASQERELTPQSNTGSAPYSGTISPIQHILRNVLLPNLGMAPQTSGDIAQRINAISALFQTDSTSNLSSLTRLTTIIRNMFSTTSGSTLQAATFAPLASMLHAVLLPGAGSASQSGVLAQLLRQMPMQSIRSTVVQRLTDSILTLPGPERSAALTNILRVARTGNRDVQRAASLAPQLRSMLLHDHHWHTSITENHLQVAQQAQQAQSTAQTDAFSFNDSDAQTLHLPNMESASGETNFMDMYHAALGNQSSDGSFSADDGAQMEYLRPKKAEEPQRTIIHNAVPPTSGQPREQEPAHLPSLSNLPPGELDKLVDQLYRELERRVDFERQLRGF